MNTSNISIRVSNNYKSKFKNPKHEQRTNLELPLPFITQLKRYYYEEINPINKELIRKGIVSIENMQFQFKQNKKNKKLKHKPKTKKKLNFK